MKTVEHQMQHQMMQPQMQPQRFAEEAGRCGGGPHNQWKQLIQLSNDGIASFRRGRIVEAYRLFLGASELQRLVLYDKRNRSTEYRCKWVNMDQSIFLSSDNNPSDSQSQSGTMSHVCMTFLHIQNEEEESNVADAMPRVAPDVIVANVQWAIDFNLALASQLLGIVFPTGHEGMYLRALSFDIYERIGRDIVDWYEDDEDDGYAPLAVAVFVMAIYNNQGAMFFQLGVPHQMETYWGRMRRIWNRASHLFGKRLSSNLFRRNLEFLQSRSTHAASAA